MGAENGASTVTIHRKTGRVVQDPVTGLEVPGWATPHTALPFRLVGGTFNKLTIGGVTFDEATARGDFPASTVDLADNDLVEITAGEWAGSVYRVVEAIKGDQRTARRVPVVEAQRPSEWGA